LQPDGPALGPSNGNPAEWSYKMFTFMFIFGWLGFAAVVGTAAVKRCDRSGIGWFFLALAISPLMAGLFLIAVGRKAPRVERPAAPRHSHWDKLRRKYNAEKAARLGMAAVDAATR
jgi:hypothetical protein